MTKGKKAEVIKHFVRTGDTSVLIDLTESFKALYVRDGSGYLDVKDATIVMEHLLRILSQGSDPTSELCVFVCVQRLTSYSTNQKLAAAILDVLQAHPTCNTLLEYVTTTTNETADAVLLHHCIEFTMHFLFKSGERQEMLFRQEKLIRAILQSCSKGLQEYPSYAKCDLLGLLGSLLNLNMAAYATVSSGDWSVEKQGENLTKFLQLGGLRATVRLVAAMLVTRTNSSIEDMNKWVVVCNVLRHLLCMFCSSELAAVPPPLRTLDLGDLATLTSAFHKRLQEGPPNPYMIACIGALSVNFDTFLYYTDLTVERFFFYAGETGTGNSMLRMLHETVTQCADAQIEGAVLTVVETTKARLPHLAARIDAELQIVIKDDKDRHCARPGCPISGKGLMGAQMMKCGRCLSVYYCSKEHQKEHWSAHKVSCRPAEK